MRKEQPEVDYNAVTERQSFEPLDLPFDVRAGLEMLGKGPRRLIELKAGSNLIGRSVHARVVLRHRAVSRRHAEIMLGRDGRAILIELGSSNGTYVNGARVNRVVLREGDRIRIGSVAAFRYGRYSADQMSPQRLGERGQGSETQTSPPPTSLPLSARERQVAQLVADGLSNLVIGARLHISARTVSTHLNNVYKRLGVHTRVQLTRILLARAEGQAASVWLPAASHGELALATMKTQRAGLQRGEQRRGGPVSERAAIRLHLQSERASHPGQ